MLGKLVAVMGRPGRLGAYCRMVRAAKPGHRSGCPKCHERPRQRLVRASKREQRLPKVAVDVAALHRLPQRIRADAAVDLAMRVCVGGGSSWARQGRHVRECSRAGPGYKHIYCLSELNML